MLLGGRYPPNALIFGHAFRSLKCASDHKSPSLLISSESSGALPRDTTAISFCLRKSWRKGDCRGSASSPFSPARAIFRGTRSNQTGAALRYLSGACFSSTLNIPRRRLKRGSQRSGHTSKRGRLRACTSGTCVAFVPMNLPYAMLPAEVAECVKAFRPKAVYPYHYRGQNPEEFKAALKSRVKRRTRRSEVAQLVPVAACRRRSVAFSHTCKRVFPSAT